MVRNSFYKMGLAVAALCGVYGTANADGIQLRDNQMDSVTAGGISVISSADAGALASYRTMASAAVNTIVGTNPGVAPGFQSEGGLASGVAVGFGTNGGNNGAPAPVLTTNVVTGGTADGNYKVTIMGGGTVSALGMTIQIGFTSVYGVWIPGL